VYKEICSTRLSDLQRVVKVIEFCWQDVWRFNNNLSCPFTCLALTILFLIEKTVEIKKNLILKGLAMQLIQSLITLYLPYLHATLLLQRLQRYPR